jgi:hypothetical protein
MYVQTLPVANGSESGCFERGGGAAPPEDPLWQFPAYENGQPSSPSRTGLSAVQTTPKSSEAERMTVRVKWKTKENSMLIQKHMSAVALAGLMAVAAPVGAFAQTQETAPTIEEVSSDELDAFVVAYRDVQVIDAEYGAQMAETTDDSELQELQQDAQIAISGAVEAAPDIDMERFVEILTVAQADAELGAEIMDKLNE